MQTHDYFTVPVDQRSDEKSLSLNEKSYLNSRRFMPVFLYKDCATVFDQHVTRTT